MNIVPALKQTVSITPRSSLSDGGIPQYTTPVSTACRIDYKTTIIRNAQGQEVSSSASIFLGPSATVALTSRITMPDSTYRDIIDLRLHYDLKGTLIFKEVIV